MGLAGFKSMMNASLQPMNLLVQLSPFVYFTVFIPLLSLYIYIYIYIKMGCFVELWSCRTDRVCIAIYLPALHANCYPSLRGSLTFN